MCYRVKIVPWSSVVGHSVLIIDEHGAQIAQLSIRNADHPKEVAELVASAFDALHRVTKQDAHAEILARIAEKQIA